MKRFLSLILTVAMVFTLFAIPMQVLAAGETIAVSSTGLGTLQVGKSVNGTVTYELSGGNYAGSITAADFTVSGLPDGLSAGEAERTGDTAVTIAITGTPTAFAGSGGTLTTATSIPAANIDGASESVSVTGSATYGAVSKGDGNSVSAAPTASVTDDTITVNAGITVVAGNTEQTTVEYAVSTSSTEPSTGWQETTAFSGLDNDDYYVFARAKASTNYVAGTAKVSAATYTVNVVAQPTMINAVTVNGFRNPAAAKDINTVGEGGFDLSVPSGANYSVTSISYSPLPQAFEGGNIFAPGTQYTATIVLTAKENYQFANGVKPSVPLGGGGEAAGTISNGTVGTSGGLSTFTFTIASPATAARVDAIAPLVPSVNFGTANEGYSQIAYQEITIKNNGNTVIKDVTVSLAGSDFEIVQQGGKDISADILYIGSTETIRVRPVNGLSAKATSYTATVTVSGKEYFSNAPVTTSATLGFKVNGSSSALPMVLTPGVVSRTKETTAEVNFTSTKDGAVSYLVVDAGSATPGDDEINVAAGNCTANTQKKLAVTLTAGAKDIYIKVVNATDNQTMVLKVAIPAFVNTPKLIQAVISPKTGSTISSTASTTFTADVISEGEIEGLKKQWSIMDYTDNRDTAGTYIDQNTGALTIGSNETSQSIKVICTVSATNVSNSLSTSVTVFIAYGSGYVKPVPPSIQNDGSVATNPDGTIPTITDSITKAAIAFESVTIDTASILAYSPGGAVQPITVTDPADGSTQIPSVQVQVSSASGKSVSLVFGSDFTLDQGSVVVILTASGLSKVHNALGNGTHTLSVTLSDGTAKETIHAGLPITRTPSGNNSGQTGTTSSGSTVPRTGDSNAIGLWIALLIISASVLTAAVWITVRRRKRVKG